MLQFGGFFKLRKLVGEGGDLSSTDVTIYFFDASKLVLDLVLHLKKAV